MHLFPVRSQSNTSTVLCVFALPFLSSQHLCGPSWRFRLQHGSQTTLQAINTCTSERSRPDTLEALLQVVSCVCARRKRAASRAGMWLVPGTAQLRCRPGLISKQAQLQHVST